ncbi:flagellar hook-basal body protein [Niallia sp. NCCP-28]|uniref:flagellar hook-basal body protein n=1 Tax=Niallia sp. NCCP-28 TaxID=2934712 RepID=UPI00207F406F|nr:flagellar hook-basal body protein [Niallia sp. NCCP-28]GKU83648.1 flagellar hook-basal body complex protein FlhP [Niallia sp. NCCP-28]
MNRVMLTATNTLAQLQQQMDSISNNIANIDTNGYKKQNATFTDLLTQQFNNQKDAEKEVNRLTANGIRQGVGAKLAQTQTVMTQGSITTSDRSLDTAFTKEGQLYRVQINNGDAAEIQYTRDGAFYLSPVSDTENMLVTKEGYSVLDENNSPIILSNKVKDYKISPTGTLIADLNNGQEQNVNLGVSYANFPQLLEKKGNNLYGIAANAGNANEIVTDLDGDLRGQIAVQQNASEKSNVDISSEMVNLMATQRAYQFQSRSITMADQMMGLVNGIR